MLSVLWPHIPLGGVPCGLVSGSAFGRTPSLTHLLFPYFLQPPALQDHNGFLWGFQDMGSQAAQPVPTVLAGLGSPQAWQHLLCQAQRQQGVVVFPLNPHCVFGEGLLLTTGSGRPQPGWRRRHPLPHHKAGSRRRRRGSSPPRHTVRKEI